VAATILAHTPGRLVQHHWQEELAASIGLPQRGQDVEP